MLAARIVAGLLATYLLWIPVREGSPGTRGSLLGWPVEALAAAAAFVIGFGSHGLGAPAMGPAAAQAAGFGLAALAVLPLAIDRDPLRMGIGALLLVHAAMLLRVGLGGTPPPLEQLVSAGVAVGIGAAIALLRSAHDVAFGAEPRPPAGAAPAGVRARPAGNAARRRVPPVR